MPRNSKQPRTIPATSHTTRLYPNTNTDRTRDIPHTQSLLRTQLLYRPFRALLEMKNIIYTPKPTRYPYTSRFHAGNMQVRCILLAADIHLLYLCRTKQQHTMQSCTKQQLAHLAGVSPRTFRRWLIPYRQFLSDNHVTKHSRILPPQVVNRLVQDFCIDIHKTPQKPIHPQTLNS